MNTSHSQTPGKGKAALPAAARLATQESVDELTKKVDTLMEMMTEWIKSAPPPPSSLPPPISIESLAPILEVVTRQAYEGCSKALSDKQDFESKEKRAVVIGSVEKTDPVEALASDQELVQALIAHSDDPDVIQAWDDGTISFHRHPKDKKPGKRPLKIEFPSKSLRDSLLSSIRSKPGRPLPAPAFVRMDLTPHQLLLERAAREDVMARNLLAGKIVYGLRDFSIINYRTPRDLPPNYGKPRAPLSIKSADGTHSGLASRLSSSTPHSDAPLLSDADARSTPDPTPVPPPSNVTTRRR
ncbi:hypothetical protein DXG03_009494 [Asterophora parasitica]|uniref:Uncharacterized protein n=1 Tax=Asterophora parasitica TaxID=117018 RepID=A0A9P7K8V5_9AGAR|nr:hypothetical protein DXG03_009494 [Asterophora parasitica]